VQGAGDANRRLVRFFSICLSSLVFIYSLLAVRIFIEGHAFALTDWVLVAAKAVLGLTAVVVAAYPAWLAGPLERQIDEMGSLFEGAYADAAVPNLILVDLNLSKYTGEDILCEIQRSPHLAGVPVCVWSSSQSPRDEGLRPVARRAVHCARGDSPQSQPRALPADAA
jgi:CheY-like chemotaxis protein